ncbi:hypothetical protein DNTS_027928, partial [Danionella cerebrum]
FGDKGVLLAKDYVETNKIILSDGDERFRGRLKLDHVTRSLTIINAKTSDSGFYELQIGGSESLQTFVVSVTALRFSTEAIAGICGGVIATCALIVVALIYFFKDKAPKDAKGSSQRNDLEWWYENSLIAKHSQARWEIHDEVIDGRFASKLRLEDNGDLIISNTRKVHSGVYKLTSRNRNTIYKRFTVTIDVKRVPVTEGGDVLLETGVRIEPGQMMLWTFGPSNCLVVKADSERIDGINERFRGRVDLDLQTGSLTIRNITDEDLGHFKLQIVNSTKTRFRRFNVV